MRPDLIDGQATGRRDHPHLEESLAVWFASHETAAAAAYERQVSGHGQLHPLSRGLPDSRTYLSGDGTSEA